MLQPFDYLHGPPQDLLQQLHILLTLGAPGLDAVLQMGPHELTIEGNNPLPLSLLAIPLMMQPRIPLAFWAASTHWWLVLSFSSTRTPKAFSAASIYVWVYFSSVQNLALRFVELLLFLLYSPMFFSSLIHWKDAVFRSSYSLFGLEWRHCRVSSQIFISFKIILYPLCSRVESLFMIVDSRW